MSPAIQAVNKVQDIFLVIACLFLLPFYSISAQEKTLAPWVGSSFSGELCDGGEMEYGPFDYTNGEHRAHRLPIVEEYHFTKDIQMLIKGKSGYLTDELNYTVVAFPNHHKALNALMNYQLIYKYEIDTKAKRGFSSPMECYFQRAIHFSPKDLSTYLLYATYLRKTQHIQDAEKLYKTAIDIAPDELPIKHSYGVFLFEQKKYAEAVVQAKRIYGKNYAKQKLKDLLIKSGHWQQ